MVIPPAAGKGIAVPSAENVGDKSLPTVRYRPDKTSSMT